MGVSELIPHEDYGQYSLVQDILLMRLDPPLIMSQFIQPIQLADKIFDVNDTQCVLTGWGRDENDLPRSKMQKVDMPLITEEGNFL